MGVRRCCGATTRSSRLRTVRTNTGKDDRGDLSLLVVKVKDPATGRFAALMVSRMDAEPGQPHEGLDRTLREDPTVSATSAIRRTRVGDSPAWGVDVTRERSVRQREYRFAHEGRVYAAAIMYRDDDPELLDTALAALQTFRWLD